MGFLRVPTVVDPVGAGPGQPVPAGLADRFAAALVFIAWCDAPDRGREPNGVVVLAYAGQFRVELGAVADVLQVWPFSLHVSEEGLNPGLVLGNAGPAELAGDRDAGEELLVLWDRTCGPLSLMARSSGRFPSAMARSMTSASPSTRA